jgi:hypothetical protein
MYSLIRRVINHQESDGSNKMVKSLNKFVTNAVPVLLARVYWRLYQPVTTANYVGDKLYGLYLKVLESLAPRVMHKHLNL